LIKVILVFKSAGGTAPGFLR